jgi:hypothetical protein
MITSTIDSILDYLYENGYYGNVDIQKIVSMCYHGKAFEASETLCNGFSDKDGGEVSDHCFNVVLDYLRDAEL